MSAQGLSYAVVIPTTGRRTLTALVAALDAMAGPSPAEIVVVVDRGDKSTVDIAATSVPLRVFWSGGRGPAVARNIGWRAVRADWVVFLDDDVLPEADWAEALHRDLLTAADDVAANQATIVVPLPADRRPTDWERNTAGLCTAWWITADMAYRRDVLAEVGGFDEVFPRAYREDADLALRVRSRGYLLAQGTRRTTHPVRAAGFFASVRAQQGNADNAVLRRKYGRNWRQQIGEGPGRIRQHSLTTVAGAVALLLIGAGRRNWAAASAGTWLALTTEFAFRRITAGPCTSREISRMAITSAVIPPLACWHRLRGELRAAQQAREDSR